MFGPVVLRGGSVVPEDALTWRFSRSSGPGGQSVNTADSRVELSVDLAAITWATAADRDRVLTRLAPRLALAEHREGTVTRDERDESDRVEAGDPVGTVLSVAASEYRSQLRNREAALARVTPPLPGEAIAVGGTARALRKLVGRSLGPDELKEAFRLLRKETARSLATRYGIDVWRARALPAGAAIVAELQALLGVPLEVGRGGLREGVALELLDGMSRSAQAGGR